MKAKVALNLHGLDDRGKLAKLYTALTKLTGNATMPDPDPTLAVAQVNYGAAKTSLDNIDTKEQELVTLRIQRDQLMDKAMDDYSSLGSYVQNKSKGDAAVIANAGFDVAGARTPAPPVSQVLNLVLTVGDFTGALDAAWDRDPSAKSYEVQVSVDPMTDATWAYRLTAPKSSTTITGLTSGAKMWVRARAIGSDGPGAWSDPAVKIVP